MKSNHRTGHFLERWTAFLFFFKGYSLLARNYTVGRGTGAGEIDLIFKRGKTVIFVEVKKRVSLDRAKDAITLQNQMRVIKSSAVFLARHPRYKNYTVRYDAVIYDNSLFPRHLKNAWRVM